MGARLSGPNTWPDPARCSTSSQATKKFAAAVRVRRRRLDTCGGLRLLALHVSCSPSTHTHTLVPPVPEHTALRVAQSQAWPRHCLVYSDAHAPVLLARQVARRGGCVTPSSLRAVFAYASTWPEPTGHVPLFLTHHAGPWVASRPPPPHTTAPAHAALGWRVTTRLAQ